jgi:CubicO group peptidase (beta-lactamase class C family)
MHVRRLAVGSLLSAALIAIAAETPVTSQPSWSPRIDQIFAAWNSAGSPGCAAAIYQDGRIVFERGYGMADLEHDVPISAETVFYVGSLSKQFTAFAAALAIRDGRLLPDHSIRKYLPELPDYADAIKVRHLIHHTSGLRDYNTLLSIAGRRGDDAYDNAAVLRITARQTKLNFPPGAEYLYSNTGYTLLATVVERAIAAPFATFADTRIFAPLGMASTHYHVNAGRLVKRRAYAYQGSAGAWTLDTPNNERAGAGGLFTSVRDLVRWDENFYSPKVGDAALMKQVQTPGRLDGGGDLSYAWGLQVGRYRGAPIVEHSGALGGYRAHLMRFPERHLSVVALCNLGSIQPGVLVRQVADIVAGGGFTQLPPEDRPAAGNGSPSAGSPAEPRSTPAGLEDYAGSYRSDEIDATFTVSVRDNALWLQRDAGGPPARLIGSGADAFRAFGLAIRFERTPDRVVALVVDAGRVRDIRFDRTDKKGSRP